ncbi:MAG: hypothetical protein QME48_01120 [bacterium]|nr:hypothetical protein [bacterium]
MIKKILFLGVIFSLILTSCFLLPQEVSIDDTKTFLNDFENSINDPTSQYNGENTTMTMAATQDFFNKGGTSKGTLLFPSLSFRNLFKPEVKTPKLLFDFNYGTYEYDSTAYDFILTDDSSPANGYLFKWVFVDSLGTDYNMELLFDSLQYYSGDPYQSTPTKLYVALKANSSNLMWLKINAIYTTISGYDYDEYQPTSLQTHFEVSNEVAFELDYVGHESGDTIVIIDSLRAKVEDILNDDWNEYTVRMNSDTTVDFTMENKEGWFMAINAQQPVQVDSTYSKLDFTGELKYKDVHAADLSGYIWEPEDVNHLSIMVATFPDGSSDTLILNPQIPQTK